MSPSNKYEQMIDELLNEAPQGLASALNAAQTTMDRIAPGTQYLFSGPGLISNKYDPQKRYYPNIRASFMGWRNISLDKASSALIAEINKLKQIKSWSPKWSPIGTPYEKMISNNYSSDFVTNAENDMKKALENLKNSYKKMPMNTDLQNEFNELIQQLSTMDRARDPAAYKNVEDKKNELFKELQTRMAAEVGQGAERKALDAEKRFGPSDPRTLELKRAAKEQQVALNKNIQYSFQDPYGTPSIEAPAVTTGAAASAANQASSDALQSMGSKAEQLATAAARTAGETERYTYEFSEIQKQDINMIRNEFEKAFQKFEEIMSAKMSLAGEKGDKSTPGASNAQIDSPDKRISGTILREDGTIYRDQWDAFLVRLQNAIIGASQRGYTSGGDLFSILRGQAYSKYVPRGAAGLEKELGAIDPQTLEKVHNDIMVPLFLNKKPTLIYATSKQWDSISQGGRLFKGLTGVAGQTYQAGAQAPKPKLGL